VNTTPERFPPQEPRESRLLPHVDVAQRLTGDRDHVPGALERAAHFVRGVAHWPAHLPGDLRGDQVASLLEGIAEPRHDRRALRDRCVAPLALRGARTVERGLDLRRGCQRSLDKDMAVGRRDGALFHRQMISK
jgi:hypothetical protein